MLGENFVIVVVWENVPPHPAVHVNCDVQVPSGFGPPVLADAPLGNATGNHETEPDRQEAKCPRHTRSPVLRAAPSHRVFHAHQ